MESEIEELRWAPVKKDPRKFIASMEQAKSLCTQMKFVSAALTLQRQVLKPVIRKIKRSKGFRRYIQPLNVWKHHKWSKINTHDVFCEVYVQLTEIGIVLRNDLYPFSSSIFLEKILRDKQRYKHTTHYRALTQFLKDEGFDGAYEEDVSMIWHDTVVNNPQIQQVLISSYDLDVIARLRFTSACVQVVLERFYRKVKPPKTHPPWLSKHDDDRSIEFEDSSSSMAQLVCDMIAQIKLQTDRPAALDALLSQAALLRTLEAFRNIPELNGWLEIWQLWKELHFPEEHLEWIMFVALTIIGKHARRCQYRLRETYNMEKFYADLLRIIERSLDCNLFVVSSECLRIILEFTVRHSEAVNAFRFAKSTFSKILKIADRMKGIEIGILISFLDVKSVEIPKIPEAHALFGKLADKMCIVNKRAHIRDQDLYTYMHKMSYKLVLISDEWQDIDLMIETLEKFSTSLESFDQQMLGHLGLAYLVKGKQIVTEGNDTEAKEWFEKSRITFCRAHDVPKSKTYGLVIFKLMLAMYYFDRKNFQRATKLLTSCATAPEQFIPGFKMLCHLLSPEFENKVLAYFDVLELEKLHFKPEGDFKLRLGVIVRSLLVNCLIELGRKDEAKQIANDLFHAVRLSFRKTSQHADCASTMLERIINASSTDESTNNSADLADQFADLGTGLASLVHDRKLWPDEKTLDEIRFQDSVSRKLRKTVYSYDVTTCRVGPCPDTDYKSMLRHLLPVKEEMDLYSKKAMYYSISGHTFKVLGLVGSAQNAFQRAQFCKEEYPTCEANLQRLSTCMKASK